MLLPALILSALLQQTTDWPQYRGPNRDDVSAETGLLKSWPAGGPPLLWTFANAGVGLSGPAIVGDRLYTTGGRGEVEYLIAIDVKSGKEAWALPIGPLFQFDSNKWSSGPSATPTVSGGLVYALGGNGDLLCASAATGKEAWRKSLPKELDAQVNPIGGGPKNLGWGFTWSPLVDGEQLVCLPGGPKGTVAALDRKSGRLIWQSAEVKDQAAYTSPMVAEIDGIRQYVVLTNPGLFGVLAKDGRLLWRQKREQGAYGTEVINSPIVQGNHIFTTVSVGNGGCELLKVAREGNGFKLESVYANKNLQNHHGNVIRVGEHVFGHSDGRGWVCHNFMSGMNVWSDRKLGAGSVVFADGRLYCYSETDGTTVLVEASAEGWKEGGRFKIPQQSKLKKPSGRIWTPPVVAGGRLYLRDQDLLFCYDVKSR
jgi:outer membrane protein assembly factor BamB